MEFENYKGLYGTKKNLGLFKGNYLKGRNSKCQFLPHTFYEENTFKAPRIINSKIYEKPYLPG